MDAYIEIQISPDRDDLLEAVRQVASKNNLEYEEYSHVYVQDSIDVGSEIISNSVKFVTAVSEIAGFLIKLQPTIQELIKANASKGITISCGEKKIEIKGENDIEKALTAFKQL
jgi:hypothetical protein